MEDETYSCPICHDTFKSPVSLPCGHNYCGPCLKKHLYFIPHKLENVATCPECSRQFDTTHFYANILLARITGVEYESFADFGRDFSKEMARDDATGPRDIQECARRVRELVEKTDAASKKNIEAIRRLILLSGMPNKKTIARAIEQWNMDNALASYRCEETLYSVCGISPNQKGYWIEFLRENTPAWVVFGVSLFSVALILKYRVLG
jgi:hypothetical protein